MWFYLTKIVAANSAYCTRAERTPANKDVHTFICMNLYCYSKYEISTNTRPWSHKPSVKATVLIFPPPPPL